MKTITFLFICIFSFTFNTVAQDLLYLEIEKELNEEQKEIFDLAVKTLQKAQGNINNADAIDRKYEKKRNKPNWELKTWEAKEQRILAERNYKQAYSMIAKVYSDIITNAEYKTKSDEEEAFRLNNDAKAKFKKANGQLSQYKDISKEAVANINYEKLTTDVKEIQDLNMSGIRNQITALEIARIGIRKKADEEDLAAWEKAKSKNTIDSYHEYLNNNPKGKYMAKANDKIRELEKTSDIAYTDNKNTRRTNKKNRTNNNTEPNLNTNNTENKTKKNYNEGDLVFKVQIAADKTVVSDWILNHKAPGVDLIEEYRTPEWYKYMVGSFPNYHKAAKYRDKLRSTAPDAFIVVFEKGKPIPVTMEMKN